MSNEKLTFLARYVLTYIKFRTNNNHPFFESNDTIAKKLGYKSDSIRVIVNNLIREGYIIKNIDDKGKRILSLSGKEFLPLNGVDMSSLDKRILKQEIQNQERDANYYKQEYDNVQNRIQILLNENTRLNKQILDLQMELMELKEKQSNPTPISRTEEPMEQQENQEPKQSQPSISQETPTTTDKIETPTETQKTEEISQAVGRTPEEVIAEILGRPIEKQGFNYDYKK